MSKGGWGWALSRGLGHIVGWVEMLAGQWGKCVSASAAADSWEPGGRMCDFEREPLVMGSGTGPEGGVWGKGIKNWT